MTLHILEGSYTVCQIADASHIRWDKGFVSATRTADELSLVCESGAVPPNATQIDAGWSAFYIDGVLDFGMVGVLAQLSATLAQNGVSLFALSTYNTDYLLVKEKDMARAVQCLQAAGHTFA